MKALEDQGIGKARLQMLTVWNTNILNQIYGFSQKSEKVGPRINIKKINRLFIRAIPAEWVKTDDKGLKVCLNEILTNNGNAMPEIVNRKR